MLVILSYFFLIFIHSNKATAKTETTEENTEYIQRYFILSYK